DVSSFKADGYVRHLFGDRLAQFLLERLNADARTRGKSHSQYSFLRSTGPQIYAVDRITRWHGTSKCQADCHIVSSGYLIDNVKELERHHFCSLHARTSGSAQAHLKLSRVDRWEKLHAKLAI